ncbi:hypothetical protein DNTS_018796 [Danionella cerebrum]|uniref:Major facilitator superfamily associated domain-containing protein n=1 Tax=Danionella cerebrum TaxID=2873325 RepID=A0A553QNB5_9TELE|nr:hypothetical protein DNTS_018796 [Danionella translucida]
MKKGVVQKSKQWNVKGAMRLAGVFHFLHSCGTGCLLPFLTLYFRHLGLSASMIGIIMASKHLAAFVWRPLSSVLARKYDKRRTVVVGSLVSSGLVVLVLLLFPSTGVKPESGRCNSSQPKVNPTPLLDTTMQIPFLKDHNATVPSVPQISVSFEPPLESSTTSSFEPSAEPPLESSTKASLESSTKASLESSTKASLESSTKASLESSAEPPLESITEPLLKSERLESSWSSRGLKSLNSKDTHGEFLGSLKVMDAQHQMFFLVLIVTVLWEFVATPLEWTVHDGLYEYLDFVDATDRQSSVNVWKQLGAASGNCLVGVLVTNLFCLIGLRVEFYSYTTLMVLTVPVAVLLPMYLRKREHLSSGGVKAMQLVYGNSQAILCAVTVVLMGMVSSAVSDFLLWQMQDIGAIEIHLGVCLAMVHISQTGFAPLSGPLSRILKYHGWLLVLASVGLAMQCLYYSFLWTPWGVLPAQLVAGFSIGTLWWSVALQSEEIATPGTEKTILRLFEVLSLEFGAAIGSLIAGFVVQKFGCNVLFQGAAVLLALWSSALSVLKWKIPRQRRINYSRLLAADTELSESESDQEKDWLETAMDESGRNNNNRTINKF